jgi:hypothetical protein
VSNIELYFVKENRCSVFFTELNSHLLDHSLARQRGCSFVGERERQRERERDRERQRETESECLGDPKFITYLHVSLGELRLHHCLRAHVSIISSGVPPGKSPAHVSQMEPFEGLPEGWSGEKDGCWGISTPWAPCGHVNEITGKSCCTLKCHKCDYS